MDQLRPNFLSGPYYRPARGGARGRALDRAGARRSQDPLSARPGHAQLLTTGSEPRIAFLDQDAPLVRAAPDRAAGAARLVAGRALRADRSAARTSLEPPGRTRASRSCGRSPRCCGAQEAALLAYARALAHLARAAAHCGVVRHSRREPTHAGHCLRCTQPGLRAGVLSAHRSGHHRAGERRRAGAARAPAELAAAALLDHRRLRRTGREPRGRGAARGAGGDRRRGASACATTPRSPGRSPPR